MSKRHKRLTLVTVHRTWAPIKTHFRIYDPVQVFISPTNSVDELAQWLNPQLQM